MRDFISVPLRVFARKRRHQAGKKPQALRVPGVSCGNEYIGSSGTSGSACGTRSSGSTGSVTGSRSKGGTFRWRTFHTLLEHKMHAQADAQKGNARKHAVADHVHLPQLAHGGCGIGKGTHARQHNGIGCSDFGRIACHNHLTSHSRKTALHTEQIALLIINDCNHYSAPFVDGS